MNTDICRFGLIVTGKGEEQFLPVLFRIIMAQSFCTFEVIRRIGQRSPITSSKRQLTMAGSRGRLPTKDEEDIGLPAQAFLRRHSRSAVVVIDDLEGDRRSSAGAVFRRYRDALDMVLKTTNIEERAAVHFLVNMLEAYYFAQAAAVNMVAGRPVLLDDHPTDVEEIRHPKATLRAQWPQFDEVEHGENILRILELEYILRRPKECCWLRSLFAWCVDKLVDWDAIHDISIRTALRLPDGCKSVVTYPQ